MKKNSPHGRRAALSRIAVALGSALAVAPHPALAKASFPTRPITMVVGWPAGGSADNVSRLVANRMAVSLGQPFIVDNHAGAGGNIASELVARSKPDGYTIMLATSASHGWNSELYNSLRYHPIEDFAPIGLINTSPGTLLVASDAPYHSLRDLIAAARANPGKLTYGSAGVGSSQHMAGAMLKKIEGIEILHVPYKGLPPALTDLMAGRVDMVISTGAVPFIHSGKLRALAVAAPSRLPALPDVPTFEQEGLRNYSSEAWYGLVAPAGTPRPVLETLHAALSKALENAEVKKLFAEQGALPAKVMSIDEFWSFVKQQMPIAAEQVRASGAKIE